MEEINIGMYDDIKYKCFWCKKETYSQTKLLSNLMTTWEVGDVLFFPNDKDFYNCILNLKNKCEKCGKETAIVIKNGKFIGVENPKFSTIIEHHFGNYEVVDELEIIVNEKLRKIENEKRGT